MIDSAGLEVLDRDECLRLLRSAPVGRIAFTNGALPVIQPVNFLLHEDAVVIRTGQGSKLAAATRYAVVAFQADQFDPCAHSGWSVMVVGHTQAVQDDTEIAELRALPLHPWVPAARDHFVRIAIELVSGRRIRG